MTIITNFQAVLPLLLLFSVRAFPADVRSGRVVGWGDNSAGVVNGVPHVGFSVGTPVAERPITNAVAVAVGYFHALALRSDGTAVGWGSNQKGQALGSEPGTDNNLVIIGGKVISNIVAVAAGNFSLALTRNGTVLAWGDNHPPQGLSNVVAIAARGFYSLALRDDGSVISWGSQPWCQTHVPSGLSNVVAIAAGGGDYERSMALRRDGTVVVWKSDLPTDELVPAEVTNVQAIATGKAHSLALRKDGTVFGWGFNRNGQATGVPTKENPYTSSGLVTIEGIVLTNVVAISAADEYNLALKENGSVVAWGNHRFYADVPSNLTNVVAIVAGEGFCLAITTNYVFALPQK